MNRKLAVSAIMFIIVSFIMSPMAYADEPELGRINHMSMGLGIDWGGLGVNYTGVPEDSNFGMSIGVGSIIFGVAGAALLVTRFNDHDSALFIGVFGGAASGYSGGGGVVEYGNLPDGSHRFLWRVGFAEFDEGWTTIAGFGISM